MVNNILVLVLVLITVVLLQLVLVLLPRLLLISNFDRRPLVPHILMSLVNTSLVPVLILVLVVLVIVLVLVTDWI